jgi:hypothetical protein
MRRQRLGLLVPITAAVVILVGILIGVASALGAALLVIAGLAIVGHLWFVTWGPTAEPNRFHRRELWENQRRVHRELRRHHHDETA